MITVRYEKNLCQIKERSNGNPVKKIQIEFLQANAKASAGGMIAILPVDSVEPSSPSPSPPAAFGLASLPPAAAKAPANLLD